MARTALTKTPQGPNWVRSWDTDVPAARSSSQLDELLRRYGAHGYTVSTNYTNGTVMIGFTLPKTFQVKTEETSEIRVGVSFSETLRRLEKMAEFNQKISKQPRDKQSVYALAQAERVAWRQMILWVEAALNVVSAGVQTLEEAFFAHQIVRIGGQEYRAIDFVSQAKRLGSGNAR